MKKFLIISSIFLLVALVLVVGVWFWLNHLVETGQSSVTVIDTTDVTNTTETSTVAPQNNVPLKDLPLTEGQRSTIEKVGIDVDTFVITPVMQECAVEKLGQSRFDDILAGATPSMLETAMLTPCLGAN